MANDPSADKKNNQPADHNGGGEPEKPALADELGVQDLTEILFAEHGRIFSAAGRQSPIAEFSSEGVLLHPPDQPFTPGPPQEVIIYKNDERGVMLNELGQPRQIVGAKYKGMAIYTLVEQKPGTVKHYAGWFDINNKPHKLYVAGQALTSDMVFRIRNRTPDGEIGVFAEITTD
ncbi:MAG TPA: hypothetical protein V6D22_14800 [Candidatus Obscuribacterales bacterium]